MTTPRDARSTRHYRRRRAELRGRPCWRCGAPGTTADHVPALAAHDHVEGSGCCELFPACGPCNYGDGARIARRGRARRTTRRW